MSACSAGRTKVAGRAGGRYEYRHPPPSAQPPSFRNPASPGWTHCMPILCRPSRVLTNRGYSSRVSTLGDQISTALARYEADDNLGRLLDTLRGIAKAADVDSLVTASEFYRDRPEVVIPIYENVVVSRAALNTS